MKFPRGRKLSLGIYGWLVLLLAALIFLCGLCWFNNRLLPLAMTAARSKAKLFASELMNEAVGEIMDETPLHAISVSYHEGAVSSIETDVTAVNRFRSTAVQKIADETGSAGTMYFKLPVGNLLGGTLFGGRGGSLTVSLLPLGDVSADVYSEFTESGINQTLHRIYLRVRISLSVIVGGEAAKIDCAEDICIAETVIVGKVPDAYTAINRFEIDEQEENDLNDYAATIP